MSGDGRILTYSRDRHSRQRLLSHVHLLAPGYASLCQELALHHADFHEAGYDKLAVA